MKTNQIYSMLNSMSGAIVGTENMTVTDTASFISFGRVALATDDNKESCYQSMVDRIGRTIVLYEKLTADNLVERMDTLQFGAVLQTIETKSIANAKQNNSWIYGSGNVCLLYTSPSPRDRG